MNISDMGDLLEQPIPPLTDEQAERIRQCVRAHAQDYADAPLLMAALGVGT